MADERIGTGTGTAGIRIGFDAEPETKPATGLETKHGTGLDAKPETKIKICGIRRHEDIDIVNGVRPDFVGFVFAMSRRQVTFEKAADLRLRLVEGIVPVGVFVDAPISEALRAFDAGIIDIAQLHGGESDAYVRELKAARPDMQIIRAYSVVDASDIARAAASPADFVLLDHGRGGTGRAFDWSILRRFQEAAAAKAAKLPPIFLAGGVNTGNITDALAYAPYCIDVSSGAETEGTKDAEKIKTLIRAVRSEDRR